MSLQKFENCYDTQLKHNSFFQKHPNCVFYSEECIFRKIKYLEGYKSSKENISR